MKRIFVALIVVCILAAATLAATPWWINSERLHGTMTATLEQVSGRTVSFQGDANVTLSPFFGIRLSDLVVDSRENPDGKTPLLRAENALISINPLSALFGKIDIRNIELQRPRLNLTTTSDGYSNWELQSPEDDPTSPGIFGNAKNPLVISVRDGTIEYRDEISGNSESATNLTGEIDWPASSSNKLALKGNAIWRNESITLRLAVSDLGGLNSGKDSNVSVTFSSEPLGFNFEGTANLQHGIFANGNIDANSPSISRINDLFDLGLETTNIIGNWGAKGRLELKPDTLLLADASVIVNGNPATGVVRLATNEVGTSKLDGTLAFSDINVTELTTLGFLDTLSTNISRENLVLDLRLSAEHVSLGSLEIDNVASTVSNGQDGFKIDVGDASLLGGMAVGRVSIEKNGEQQVLSVFVDATDINMAGLETPGTGLNLDAVSDLHLELSTPVPEDGGNFVYSGLLELTARNGTLNGVELPLRFNPDGEQATQVEKIAGNGGSTGFETIDLKAHIFHSSGYIQKSSLKTDDYSLEVSGILNFSSGSLALRGEQTGKSGENLEQLQIGGTIFEPLISIRPVQRKMDPAPQEPEEEEAGN